MSMILSSRFNPCPICGNQKGDCRQPRDKENMWLCLKTHDASHTPPGFKFLSISKNGLWGIFVVSDTQEIISQDERSRRRGGLTRKKIGQPYYNEYPTTKTVKQNKGCPIFSGTVRRQEREARIKAEQQAHNSAALSPAYRDKATRTLHKHLGLSTKHRQELRNRGLNDAQIASGYFFSVAPLVSLPFGIPPNYPGAKNGKLSVAGTGFACPVWSVDDKIIGWQLRLDNATDNKYRWAKGNVSSHLENGELPITVVRPPEMKHQWVADIEGILKPYIAAHKLGAVCIGASGGNITASPEQLKAVIASLLVTEIRDFPDAGDVCNAQVIRRRVAKYEFYRSLGLSVKIGWWDQITKDDCDIDELPTLSSIQYISVEQFLGIALSHGGIAATTPQFPQPINSKNNQEFWTQRAQEQEIWEEGLAHYSSVKQQEDKVQWLGTYPERIEWTQKRLRSLALFNPIVQDTKFVELLVKDFLPKEEPQHPPIYSTEAQVATQGSDHSLTNLPPGLYTIAAGMGSGKTTLMLEVIRQFKEGNLISFRNSLLTQTCYDERVKHIIHFLWDLEQNTLEQGEKQRQWVKAKETWMAACVESIAKCRPKDVLILEEVEKIKNALLESATCRRNRRERLREFVRHLQRAKHIFCCDADASGSTLRWLQAIAGGKKINVIQNIKQRFQWQCYFFTGAKEILTDSTVKEYPNKRADFENKLLSSFVRGNKLLIAADSQRWGESIERALKMVRPDAKGLRVDSITKADDATFDEVNAFLQDPNKWIEENQPDYIIYTPTCEASLDITIEDYFDAVFGCFVHLNHYSCKQMLGRLRTNAPRYIFAKTHVINDDGASKSPLPQVVAKHMFQHNWETIKEIVLAEHPEIKDDFELVRKLNELIDFESGEYKDPHIQALVESRAMDNYSRANLRQNLASELERCGHIIIWQEQGDTEIKCPTSPFRKEIMLEWAQAIANSEDIDIDSAWEIQQSMTANLEERHKATKAILKERLPEFTLTSNFVYDCYLDDRQWISRQETRYLLDHPEIAKTLDCDRWVSALKYDTAWWDVRTNSLVIKALHTLKIPEIAKSGKSWDKDTDWLLEFKKRAIANSKLVKLALGITATEESDACYLLRRCLEGAGYPVKGSQRRVGGGERIRVYRVDAAVLAEDWSIYHEVYQAVGKRFAQKLEKLAASQTSHLDISISPVRDTLKTLDDDHLALPEVLLLIEESRYSPPLVDDLPQSEREMLEFNLSYICLCDDWQMFEDLVEDWTEEFRVLAWRNLPAQEKERIRNLAMDALMAA